MTILTVRFHLKEKIALPKTLSILWWLSDNAYLIKHEMREKPRLRHHDKENIISACKWAFSWVWVEIVIVIFSIQMQKNHCEQISDVWLFSDWNNNIGIGSWPACIALAQNWYKILTIPFQNAAALSSVAAELYMNKVSSDGMIVTLQNKIIQD